jgi:hypothetical protein
MVRADKIKQKFSPRGEEAPSITSQETVIVSTQPPYAGPPGGCGNITVRPSPNGDELLRVLVSLPLRDGCDPVMIGVLGVTAGKRVHRVVSAGSHRVEFGDGYAPRSGTTTDDAPGRPRGD